jgi:hypothetical protein
MRVTAQPMQLAGERLNRAATPARDSSTRAHGRHTAGVATEGLFWSV